MIKLARVGIAVLVLIFAGCASMGGSTSASGDASHWTQESRFFKSGGR